MKDSEATPDESVEQHSDQSSGPQLQSCPNCGVVGLPERIAAHDCGSNQTRNAASHKHTDTDTTTTQGPALKLNTPIARHREADHTTGSLEITRAATAGPTLTLGLISNRESTTIELTPQQAVWVADTLQATATEIVASELPEDASQTPNRSPTQDAESTPSTDPTLEVFETDD
jgi:ribosomal protein L32